MIFVNMLILLLTRAKDEHLSFYIAGENPILRHYDVYYIMPPIH
ncbi:hypothetical protein [Neobacillus cucumis]|nr:hypothetical protein [Neobacillus cucumis]MDR4945053.1 hypothetical protein [Neobacillus cucumis]